MSTPQGGRQAIVSLPLADKDQVYEAYMPFVRNGGLFVRTTKRHFVGDPVFLLVTLPGSPERTPVSGRVVWVTPPGAQGGRPAGIGVQFDDTAEAVTLRGKLEVELAGRLESDKPTATM